MELNTGGHPLKKQKSVEIQEPWAPTSPANSFLSSGPSNSSSKNNQDRLTFTNLPNLNSVPNCPVGVSVALVMPAPSAPATIEKCSLNMKDKRIPLEVTNFAKVGEEEENLNEKEFSLQLPFERCPKDVMVLGSSNELVEVEYGSTKRENDGIDWNVTPTKKPRRKKHKPKVIVDGEPARIHRQTTVLPQTPEQGKQDDNCAYKKTYVRRKKDTPVGSVLNALEKNYVEINRGFARRCLNFDFAEQQILDKNSADVTTKAVGAYAQELCHDSTVTSFSMKEEVHSLNLQEQMIQNSLNYGNTSNVKFKGTIRDQSVSVKAWNSSQITFTQTYNERGCLQKIHNATNKDSSLHIKRKRTKVEKVRHNTTTSDFSREDGCISSGWMCSKLSNNVLKFTYSRKKHACMQVLDNACYAAINPVQSIVDEGALGSRNLCLKNSFPEPITLMDCVDEMIQKLKSLSINSRSKSTGSDIENVLVPYVGHGGMIIPHEGNFNMIKMRHPRAKVDLDPESNRVWKLLMGKDDGVGDKQADVGNESWWNEERRIFRGRVDSFIARMRLVQGDRRFSQWKGSIVDSVVGVFLTQNVSDHLSSSAFMALVANFPLQSRGKFSEPNGEKVNFGENVDKKASALGSSTPNAEQNYHEVRSPDELYSNWNQQAPNPSYSEKAGQNPTEVNTVLLETPNSESKDKKKAHKFEKSAYDWEALRKKVCNNKSASAASSIMMDSLDWEAVRCANISKIADTIRERGMNNVLAERIQGFLNRLVRDHGSIDLEWLRDVPPDTTKDYLLSIRGLGLKSAECVRLLTLQHLAFPVDTNVGRICVRLGWVPLQPLPESLQLHLLELYPMLESIQKYLWPRLCKLDQRTLYELHYQMITFGKVFCTKSKPNCNACPLRFECKHFASAYASARLALPAPNDKILVGYTSPIACEKRNIVYMSQTPVPLLEGSSQSQECTNQNDHIHIVEEPASPELECPKTLESAIEDAFYEDPDEIPMIKLNMEEFTQNLQEYMHENMEIQDGSLSKAIIALTPEAASIPMPKLKNVSRLRTEHQVYELPDSHPLLNGMAPREPDDPSPYLLAIWTPGETAQSTEPPKACCDFQIMGQLCDKSTCFACSSVREAESHKVRGTLLIPCRTAMRGSFPLNGTYFQVNEVFADHHSSLNPIDIPRDWIWNLPRRTVYFGTSIPTIFRGLTTEGIQQCFWRGFVCVRGFDRVTGAPKPLLARLHFPASKASSFRKAEASVKEAKVEDVENKYSGPTVIT